jgi:hypothetical protein
MMLLLDIHVCAGLLLTLLLLPPLLLLLLLLLLPRMHADALAGRHFGELSCREFRESLLAVLPQQWTR